jgi:hypothetical protein
MHRSFWLEQALAGTADDLNLLRGAQTSDIAIVGGGFKLDSASGRRRGLAAGAGFRSRDRRNREVLLSTCAGSRVPPRRLVVDRHHRSATRRMGRSGQPRRAFAPGTFRRLDPREVARRSGSPQHLAGVIEPSNATIQPAALARAMRRHASTSECGSSSSPRSRAVTAVQQ